MDHHCATRIWGALRTSKHKERRAELVGAAVAYARLRTDWALADAAARGAMDGRRTIAHDALITAVNIMGRVMKKDGEDFEWREMLGEDRKEIGDLGCYVHCFLGLAAR